MSRVQACTTLQTNLSWHTGADSIDCGVCCAAGRLLHLHRPVHPHQMAADPRSHSLRLAHGHHLDFELPHDVGDEHLTAASAFLMMCIS